MLPTPAQTWVVADQALEAAREARNAVARTHPGLGESWKPIPPDYDSRLRAANQRYDAAVEAEQQALEALKVAIREYVKASAP